MPIGSVCSSGGADIPWCEIGRADGTIALAASSTILFASREDGSLHYARAGDPGELCWLPITAARPSAAITAMTLIGGVLYSADADGRILRRPASIAGGAIGKPDPTGGNRTRPPSPL